MGKRVLCLPSRKITHVLSKGERGEMTRDKSSIKGPRQRKREFRYHPDAREHKRSQHKEVEMIKESGGNTIDSMI